MAVAVIMPEKLMNSTHAANCNKSITLVLSS